jgi:hypothetical protein
MARSCFERSLMVECSSPPVLATTGSSVVRHLATIAVSGTIVLVLAGCAGVKDPPDATTTEATVLTLHELEALVRTSAEEDRPVQGVVCHSVSGDLALCAVTFRGPSCELWKVTNGKATGLGVVVKGASGSRSGAGVRCGN